MSKVKKSEGIWTCAACNGLEFDIEGDPEVRIISKSSNSCLILVDDGRRSHSLTFVSMETVKRRRSIESAGLNVGRAQRQDGLENPTGDELLDRIFADNSGDQPVNEGEVDAQPSE